MKKSIFLLLAILACNTAITYAKAPIKFGKVTQEELEMTQYDLDTSAVAVVLCKYGQLNSTDLSFTETRRVKILKKAGTEYSEFTFSGDNRTMVKAKVFKLIDGEIIEDKLKRESIFKERVTDDYYRIRVALPNVKEGTVYDIQVTHEFLPGEFAFQEDLPVLHSELYLETSPYIEFRKRKVGFLPIQSDGKNTYYCDNMEAFKPEPFINSAENYKTKFEFDILNISVPGYYRSYTTSWEAVNNRLASHTFFGHAIFSGSGYLSSIKKDIEADYTTPLEKVQAAYDAIKKIRWNEYKSVYTSTEALSSAYKEGEANSADINLMLMQLLLKLDLPALPVVLSTRDNGMLHIVYPSLEKLNYVIVWTEIDGKQYLLDATDELLPLGMLPKRCLNERGRLVTNESGKWIDLEASEKDQETILYNLTLDEELNLEGNVSFARYSYAAYDFRKNYKEFASEDDFLTAIEASNPGLLIKDYNLENLSNLDQPIKEKYDIKISNKVEKINNMILVNPFLFEQVEENPFKLENREYPVDFAYCKTKYLITRITIPEGYQIESTPQPIKAFLPDKKSNILINYSVIGNNINVTYKLNLAKSRYMAKEYPLLKALYSEIIKKQAEPIILKPAQNEASL
ncbi:hypothetical protein [Carboxylicivirga linearis]|uniref:DUF3857 domain-containing protein n=1 Tax=Carboxylicivirga linearis TaxID=1628157 RepID=A0ABS5JXI1_9BACT|nr:hypothetical protein [Carboxylicivirga linearis]MBS2099630.1 hypothetical protein [Carboxylicivirga linearis]